MSDSFQGTQSVPVPVTLPPVVWIGGHPTIEAPEPRGTRLRLCVRCETRGQFHTLSCERGLIVHLIDPADVHESPELWDGVTWAEPEAIAGAHKHWQEQGFRVSRKPDGPGEILHPRFRPCPECNELAMRGGLLAVKLPPVPAAPRARGRAAR